MIYFSYLHDFSLVIMYTYFFSFLGNARIQSSTENITSLFFLPETNFCYIILLKKDDSNSNILDFSNINFFFFFKVDHFY